MSDVCNRRASNLYLRNPLKTLVCRVNARPFARPQAARKARQMGRCCRVAEEDGAPPAAGAEHGVTGLSKLARGLLG
jgi:hypothetical protein